MKLLRREWADPIVSETFYCTVFQVVLLFGEEIWVLISEMSQKHEGLYVGFLQKVMGHKMPWIGGNYWQKVAA